MVFQTPPPPPPPPSVDDEMACANYKLRYYIFIVLGFFLISAPTSDLSGGTGRGTTNAVGALALGGIAAYVLSQLAAGASGGVPALG